MTARLQGHSVIIGRIGYSQIRQSITPSAVVQKLFRQLIHVVDLKLVNFHTQRWAMLGSPLGLQS